MEPRIFSQAEGDQPRDGRPVDNELRNFLGGQDTSGPIVRGVPIYFAALALETVRLGAEIADGLMARYLHGESSSDGRRNCLRYAKSEWTLTCPVYDHYPHSAFPASGLRPGYGYSTTHTRSLCFFTSMFARSEFATEMAQLLAVRDSTEDASAMITPAMVDSVALIGPPIEWRARFEALAGAGADWVIVRPFPVDQDYENSLRAAIKALARIE